MSNITLFSQIISKLDRKSFQTLVDHYKTDKHQKGFNSWNHLVSMLFCQFAKSQSVRDISNGLRSATKLGMLRNNKELYEKALSNHLHLKNKYFTVDWLRNYLLTRIFPSSDNIV